MNTTAPYGYRTIHACNCGLPFNSREDLNAHIMGAHESDDFKLWPNGNRGHGNLSRSIPITEREHDREQEEVERYQRARIR